MRYRRMRGSLLLPTTIMLALGACDPGVVSVVRPGSSDGPDVERKPFVVHAVVDPADRALADSLGWHGGVPGVEVHVLRHGTAEWLIQETDSSGTALFEDLLPGYYRVYGERVLDDMEAELVGGVIRAFGDGRTIPAGETECELLLAADRRGSLVLSEIGAGTPPPWEVGGSYYDGMFLEVYNNSDATIMLDGMIFGTTYVWVMNDGNDPAGWAGCAALEPIRTDPSGLYSNQMVAFPGGGTEYPLGPGELRVIAVGAIDHTPVHPLLLDLSGADFEFGGDRAGDNPAVPNMIDVGPRSFRLHPPPFLGSGIRFLARSLDVSSLPVALRDVWGEGYVLVPREALVDVVAINVLWPDNDREILPCIPVVHRSLQRYEGGLYEIGFGADTEYKAVRSVQRHALRLAPDGRIILMNTNTSAVDFFHGLKTPGTVPQVMR